MRRLAVACAAVLLVVASPVIAHHSFPATYDGNKPVTLSGSVTKVEFRNPQTRVSYNQLRYQFTLTDPKYYTKPWSNGWMMALAAPDVYVMEYACTDVNKSFDDGLVGPGAR